METDEEVTLPADAIIASLGERVDGAAYERFGVAVSDRGLPVLDAATMETSQAGVYAIGDGAAGVADIVRAIRDARIAANAILKAEGPAPRTYACDLEAAAEKKASSSIPRKRPARKNAVWNAAISAKTAWTYVPTGPTWPSRFQAAKRRSSSTWTICATNAATVTAFARTATRLTRISSPFCQ